MNRFTAGSGHWPSGATGHKPDTAYRALVLGAEPVRRGPPQPSGLSKADQSPADDGVEVIDIAETRNAVDLAGQISVFQPD